MRYLDTACSWFPHSSGIRTKVRRKRKVREYGYPPLRPLGTQVGECHPPRSQHWQWRQRGILRHPRNSQTYAGQSHLTERQPHSRIFALALKYVSVSDFTE